ncbi:MAG: hypothetical protein Q9187_004205 [Circinaria calcarea]
MLTTIIEDEDLLKQLVVCYFEPGTKENVGVRQALSYFLPVYCHSRRENMERMGNVALSVLHNLINLGEDMDEEEEMVGMGVVVNMLVDWTDARKLVVHDDANVSWDEAGKKEMKAVNGDIHLELASNLLEKAMGHGCPKEEKKVLIPMLAKLYITPNSNPEKIQTAFDLAAEAIDLKIASDALSRNALTKIHSSMAKVIGENQVNKQKESSEGVTVRENETVMAMEDEAEDEEEDEKKNIESPALGSEEETKMEMVADEGPTQVKDSILDELLDDEEEEEET